MPQGAKLQIYSVYKPTEFMIQWACVIKKRLQQLDICGEEGMSCLEGYYNNYDEENTMACIVGFNANQHQETQKTATNYIQNADGVSIDIIGNDRQNIGKIIRLLNNVLIFILIERNTQVCLPIGDLKKETSENLVRSRRCIWGAAEHTASLAERLGRPLQGDDP